MLAGTVVASSIPAVAVGEQLPSAQALRAEEPFKGQAIDVHIHVCQTRVPGLKPIPEDVVRLMDGPPEGMARRVSEEMKAGRISTAFGMGQLDAGQNDPLGIEAVLSVAKHVPGLMAIGVADPRRIDPEHLAAVERQIERERDKLVAFKAYLGYLHFGPEHENYRPYYRLAAKHKLPVIFHTGDNWSTTAKLKYAQPLLVDEVAVDHPDVRFVMAHFGNPWTIDAAEVIYKNDNVWADLSGLFVGDANVVNELLKSVESRDSAAGLVIADLRKSYTYAGRSDRFLYGSDWPLAPMGAYRRLIEAWIPKEDHAVVFQKNAQAVFGVKS
jgi:predicted TIM-barrel fold metal-dependent hydrolase